MDAFGPERRPSGPWDRGSSGAGDWVHTEAEERALSSKTVNAMPAAMGGAVRRAVRCVAGCLAWATLLVPVQPGSADRVVVRNGQVVFIQRGGPQETGDARKQADPKPLPLVEADEELAGYLAQAERLIEQGVHDQAIEILQALIQRGRGGFVSVGENRYVGLGIRAARVIAGLPPEGLRLYRGLYEGEAERLYERARRFGKLPLLQQVAYQYLNTAHGERAVWDLAAAHYDRARFAQAAYWWRQALELAEAPQRRAELLARIATACHLGGDAVGAERALGELRSRLPESSARLGGRQRGVVRFVEEMLKAEPPAAVARRGIWPGWGGVPDGRAVMDDCGGIVLSARWRRPDEETRGGSGFSPKLIAAGSLDLFRRGGNAWAVPKLQKGLVVAEWFQRGSSEGRCLLAPAVHPVVLDGQVIYRDDEGVTACDLLTGVELWRQDSLPIKRSIAVPDGGAYFGSVYRGASLPVISDAGRYHVTAGGGRLYLRYDFAPTIPNRAYLLRRDSKLGKLLVDDSGLAALSLSRDRPGHVVWRAGRGRGEDDVIRAGKFVSPPTYQDGRLYVIVLHVERYYLACLDAATGELLWKTPVCQPPPVSGGSGYESLEWLFDRASPPAVADGRVFVLPNVGALVAFQAGTGRPLWAYHYASDRGVGGRSRPSGPLDSVNPIIVSRGRVFCLPADSSQLVAVAADSGRPVWGRMPDRQGQSDLALIDEDRLLLSAPGLVVRSSGDGKVVHRAMGATSVIGRPAVTPTRVLACGEGVLFELDLADYALRRTPDARGLLGNLVSADDVLVAANSAGVCAYFDFETARSKFDERMASAGDEQRARLLFGRAQLAFQAEQYDLALKDLRACAPLAQTGGLHVLAGQVRTWTYATYIALGNAADDAEAMWAMFDKAAALAQTDQERAHMAIRLAKCAARGGDYARAAALAQEISETYGGEELVDPPIGADADGTVRFEADAPRETGYRRGQDLIRQLIERHGRDVYARFDGEAESALAKAVAADDPDAMCGVHDRWPNAAAADEALYRAAEARYVRSRRADGDEAVQHLTRAREQLSLLAEMRHSPLRLAANAVLALLYAQEGKLVFAGDRCARVRTDADYAPRARVRFADVDDAFENLLDRAEREGVRPLDRGGHPAASLRLPLKKRFSVDGQEVLLLRDQEGRPVRVGGRLLVLRDDRILCLDPGADTLSDAIVWIGASPVRAREAFSSGPVGAGYHIIAGVSDDGGTVAVGGRKELRGFDAETGRVVWRTDLKAAGIENVFSLGGGEGVIAICSTDGTFRCLEIDTGAFREWTARLRGPGRSGVPPPVLRAGLAAFLHHSERRLSCFDLETGRLLLHRQANGRIQARLTDAGLLVTIRKGTLFVREALRGEDGRIRLPQPLWARRIGNREGAAILDVAHGRIVIAPESGPKLEVCSLSGDGKPLATVRVRGFGQSDGVPVDARLAPDGLYVVCSIQRAGTPGATFGRQCMSRGLSVQKIDLPSGRAAWTRVIDNDSRGYHHCLPLVMSDDHVIVSIRRGAREIASTAHVLERPTGRPAAEAIDLIGEGRQPEEAARRLQSIGAAVVTEGRLCVESCEGFLVLGGD